MDGRRATRGALVAALLVVLVGFVFAVRALGPLSGDAVPGDAGALAAAGRRDAPDVPPEPAARAEAGGAAAPPREGRGVVVDLDERPVAGATVAGFTRDGVATGERVTTGRDGRFRLSLPADLRGRWVRVTAPRLVHRGAEAFVEAATETRVVLVPACPLRVRVVDAAGGGAVAGARVRVLSGEVVSMVVGHSLRAPASDEATTDAAGTATLSTEGGPAVLSVMPRDHAPTTVAGIAVPSEGTEVEVSVARGGTLEGTVRDAAGAPVAGVALRLEVPPAYRRETTSDATGRYRFEQVPQAEAWRVERQPNAMTLLAWIVATPEGGPVSTFAVLTLPEPGATRERDLELRPGSRLDGRVVAVDGRPLGALRVRLMNFEHFRLAADPSAPAVLVAEDGRFSVGPLEPGRWSVFVEDARTFRELVAENVEVASGGGSTSVTLTLPDRSGTCVLRVLDARGGAVGGAEVRASAALGTVVTEVGATETGADGSARLEGIPCEAVTVLVAPPGAAPLVVEPGADALRAGRTVVVTLPGGEARGRVRRLDGSPARVRLRLLTIHDGCGDYGPAVETEADGSFRFRFLPEHGSFEASVEDDAWTLVGDDPSVSSGDEGLLFTAVRRDEQARLHLELLLEDAASGRTVPVDDETVAVSLRGAPSDRAVPCQDATDDGRFLSAVPLPPGEHDVEVVVDGYRAVRLAAVRLPRDGPPLRVRLERGATLRGTVVDAERRPVEGVQVRVGGHVVETDARGGYDVAGTGEGRVAVAFAGRYVRSYVGEVTVPASGDATFDVSLVRTAVVRVEATGPGAGRGAWTAAVEATALSGGTVWRGELLGTRRSDGDAAFAELSGIDPGRVRVVVTRLGRASAPIEVDAPAGATTTVRVALP